MIRLVSVFFIVTVLGLFGCQSASKKETSSAEDISFSEFQKVLSPRSRLFPQSGGADSLLLIALPGDAYAKLYSLNHATREYSLKYDAGQNIRGLYRDRADKNYYFSKDNNGDENYEIYLFHPTTEKAEKVFGHEKRQATIMDSSADGTRLYISSNYKNKKSYQIYELLLGTGKVTQLTHGKYNFVDGVADPKGRYLALTQLLGGNESHLYLLDLRTKNLRKLFGKKGTKYFPSFFHPTSNELYLNTDAEMDRMACAKVELKEPKKLKMVLVNETKDLQCYFYANNSVSLVVSTYDGRIDVNLYHDVLARPIEIPFPKRAMISQVAFVPKSKVGIARVMSSDSPGDFYQFDLSLGEKSELVRITQLNQSKISNESFAKSYDFYYDSYDKMQIHGIVFAKKEWVESKEKRPVILWPHGGPDHHVSHIFHPFFQYWVQKGYVVFAPNFRGSTGYGKHFETLNDRDWGGGHIKDLIYGKNAVGQLSYVDANNIFIVGASFGGYSTLSAITQYPTEFKGAVAMVALANLFTFMKSIPPDPAWQGEFKSEVGDPVRDKKMFKERSPYFYADRIKVPLKIYQAENDVRTVKAEMDNFVEQLQKHKIPVEYEVLEKEGHAIARTENWEKILQGTVEFLNKQTR
ncbi:MAG: S9 family peptidase [Bdellovibrionales bacterium]|nr:S9 family peptidase [Bdellovibrionales bacterium]